MYLRRTILLAALSSCVLAASATAASAATFFVATTGNDANSCTSSGSPCLTIQKAVEDARLKPGASIVSVAAGTYTGGVHLSSPLDSGIAIVGAGRSSTFIANSGSEPTIGSGSVVGFRLENLTVRHETPDSNPAVEVFSAPLTLKNVDVVATGTGSESAVQAQDDFGEAPLVVIGSFITQGSAEGRDISAPGATLTMSGSTAETTGNQAENVIAEFGAMNVSNSTFVSHGESARLLLDELGRGTVSRSTFDMASNKDVGVFSELAPLSVMSSRFIETGNQDVGFEGELGADTLEHDTFAVEGPSTAVATEASTLSMTSDNVAMNDAASTSPAVEGDFANAVLRKVNVHGTWNAAALQGVETRMTSILESNFSDPTDAGPPVLTMEAIGPTGTGLLIQRSRIAGNPTLASVVQYGGSGSVVLDSSLLSGGVDGLAVVDNGNKKQQVVVAGSTIDAGTPGVSGEGGVSSIVGELAEPGRTLNVNVEGSILFEPMVAKLTGGANGLTINCQNTDAPDQSQAASSTVGAINCRSGVHGNHNLPSLGSLFASPITNYMLRKHTKAVNSVPSNTISLGGGLKPAPYDLAGRKRAEYGRVGRKCELVQDRGALQIPGQKSSCKPKKRHRHR